jgi:ribosomal subunit interface protein
MALRISGKNLDVGDAYRAHVDERLGGALRKYFDGGFTGHVVLEREASWFRTECSIHLDTGIVLQANGRAQEAHQSLDIAADRIEKRLRRYHRRLKEHRAQKRAEPATTPAQSYVIASLDEETDVASDYSPTIIAEETTHLGTMTVGEAVTAMDLSDLPLIVFRNAGHGGVNVVYRRGDGHIGWIDPSLDHKRDQKDR